ncbi:CAAX prenyl protease 2 [Scleropages formosus]|uniref:CAAX prenyl protease 2 n=1 Tax=Scleropages formosus TaxID=113540 RepID=A0A8C9W8Q1_SCLFO|nr:CAAX prenyl protease 2 [Scleropages formosus]
MSASEDVCWTSVLACFLLACSYVGSLYVWRSDLPRDHPDVIKRRFTSVLIVSALSPVLVWTWNEFAGTAPSASLLPLMGFRLESFAFAATLPLILTTMLFLGPVVQLVMESPWSFTDGVKLCFDPLFWRLCVNDMQWLRNQVVAPLTEELVFRACMLPMLVPCTGPTAAVFICPLFFGVAHFHHVIEQLRFKRGTLSGICLSAVFQFSYTAVFGAYSAFIFIRTGHLVGPVLCHSFCNYMGFPSLGAALGHPRRLPILASYLLGVVLFPLLFFPLTDPSWFGTSPICSRALGSRSVCS